MTAVTTTAHALAPANRSMAGDGGIPLEIVDHVQEQGKELLSFGIWFSVTLGIHGFGLHGLMSGSPVPVSIRPWMAPALFI
jgi:hypothetical protein